jgi:hypothetical protein
MKKLGLILVAGVPISSHSAYSHCPVGPEFRDRCSCDPSINFGKILQKWKTLNCGFPSSESLVNIILA